MTANKNLLRMKYAKVIEEYARLAGCTLDVALDRFYGSETYKLMRDGVSDMHCMSENYLAEELSEEMSKKPLSLQESQSETRRKERKI